MKQALVVVSVFFLFAGSAWAQEGDLVNVQPGETAGGEQLFTAVEEHPVDSPAEGGCQLPDFTGLSAAEVEKLALESGLEVSYKTQTALPACPTLSNCANVANCTIGSCTVTDLGSSCCQPAVGPSVCCPAPATIEKKACNCVCNPGGGPFCSISCALSSHVRIYCS